MAAIQESCSVCTRSFDVQFRYQMEETGVGFAFYCSHDCHGKSMRGEVSGGVACDGCGKRFVVELVSQVLKVRSGRSYACSDPCRASLTAESQGLRGIAALRELLPEGQAAHLRESAPVRAASTEQSIVASTMRPSEAPVGAALPLRAMPPVVNARSAHEEQHALIGAVATESARSPVTQLPRARRTHAPARLAIFNHKGGTGKTTTTVSLAAGLAARGLRVLLVDTDSQGNVGVSLGVKLQKTLYHVLVMGAKPEDVRVKVRENLDFIGSNETLAAAELYLAGRQNRDRILRERFAGITEEYDIVLVDCSPSLSLMNQNALVLADGVLVPVACDFLSLVGVRQVVKTVKNVNSLLRHPVQIYGVLPTFYDARAKICREAVETLTSHFGERCLPPIRQATKLKEAPSVGQTIFEYAAESNPAEDYLRIVDHLISGPPTARTKPRATSLNQATA